MADLFCGQFTANTHDAGGKVRLKLPPDVVSRAFFSSCQRYRYWLERCWGDSPVDPAVCFLMQNPSVADDKTIDDPTVFKCRKYATRWGYKRLIVLNVMAYRSTNPDDLRKVEDPAGRDNLQHIMTTILREKPLLVCAWGKLDKPWQRKPEAAVIGLLREIRHPAHVLRLNKAGRPWHPLYLPDDLEPQPWEPA